MNNNGNRMINGQYQKYKNNINYQNNQLLSNNPNYLNNTIFQQKLIWLKWNIYHKIKILILII